MAEQGASGTSRSKHLQPQPRGTDGSPWDPNVLQGGSCQHTHTHSAAHSAHFTCFQSVGRGRKVLPASRSSHYSYVSSNLSDNGLMETITSIALWSSPPGSATCWLHDLGLSLCFPYLRNESFSSWALRTVFDIRYLPSTVPGTWKCPQSGSSGVVWAPPGLTP